MPQEKNRIEDEIMNGWDVRSTAEEEGLIRRCKREAGELCFGFDPTDYGPEEIDLEAPVPELAARKRPALPIREEPPAKRACTEVELEAVISDSDLEAMIE